MKKLYTLLASFLITLALFAQAPEKMSYQAVVRDANNALIMNQAVGMRIQILQGSVSGTTVYEETQTPTSNDNGLVTLEIGTGTIVSGMFGTIDWSTGPYFIKTETDPNGATNYTISGTSQLMSVPYALYAKTSGNGAGPQGLQGDTGLTGPVGPQGLQGDTGLTGPVGPQGLQGDTGLTGPIGPSGANGINGFSAYESALAADSTIGLESQWLASLNGADGVDGNDGTNGAVGAQGPAGADGTGGSSPTYTIGLWPELGGYVFRVSADGKDGLVAETQNQGWGNWYGLQNLISSPSNHSVNGQKFSDWRLPTKFELNEMYLQQGAIGGFAFYFYWSSTEDDNDDAWKQGFGSGNQSDGSKTGSYSVRAVRAF